MVLNIGLKIYGLKIDLNRRSLVYPSHVITWVIVTIISGTVWYF